MTCVPCASRARWRPRRARGARSASCTCRASRAPCRTRPSYEDVVAEVRQFLRERVEACLAAGMSASASCSTRASASARPWQHNLELLRHLASSSALGLPLLVGLSRKSMVGALTGRPPRERVSRQRGARGDCGAARRAYPPGARRGRNRGCLEVVARGAGAGCTNLACDANATRGSAHLSTESTSAPMASAAAWASTP